MAWDNGTFCGEQIWTGDKPADQFGLALQRIAAAYEDDFERKPTVAELLYSISIVLRAAPQEYCSDPATIERMVISIKDDKADSASS